MPASLKQWAPCLHILLEERIAIRSGCPLSALHQRAFASGGFVNAGIAQARTTDARQNRLPALRGAHFHTAKSTVED